MPFTKNQKNLLIAGLIDRGWFVKNNGVYSPSEGLWFCDSHFNHWTPEQMKKIFITRATRIKKNSLNGWENYYAENSDVYLIIHKNIEGN